ncbi:MAG: hypothetical protein ACOWW1_03020 [archaeon]|nr:hypothetical protein [Candidatus Bathyarchaeum sp.]
MRTKVKCNQKHCVNNMEGYCQSKLRNWLGRCHFKRRPRKRKTPV